MDLGLMFRALWRHKLVMLLSITIGLALAASAASRSSTTYESGIRLLLDTPDSNLVKVGIIPGESAALDRTIQLAVTYAYLVDTEPVMERLRVKFGPVGESISAESVDRAPIVQIEVQGPYAKRTERLTEALAISFKDYIMELQNQNDIEAGNRIIVSTIGTPAPAISLGSRKAEKTLLMFLGPLLLGALAAFALENLRGSRSKESMPLEVVPLESEVV